MTILIFAQNSNTKVNIKPRARGSLSYIKSTRSREKKHKNKTNIKTDIAAITG